MEIRSATERLSDQPPPLLWREALGHALRMRRTELGLTLAQVSHRSGVSTQYLSEIERGLKDPSSEVIEAIAAILGLPLPQVLTLTALSFAPRETAAPVAPMMGRAQLSLVA